MKQYLCSECDLEVLKQKTVAIIGYGDEGCLHAKKLRNKGMNIIIGLPGGFEEEKGLAVKDGFVVMGIEEAVREGNVISVLLPDELQEQVFEGMKSCLGDDKFLLFTSGYNVFYSNVVPPENADVAMVVPECPGNLSSCRCGGTDRSHALVAVYQNISGGALECALAYAAAVAEKEQVIIRTSFAEEAEARLLDRLSGRNRLPSYSDESIEVTGYSGYLPEQGFMEGINSLEYAAYVIENGGCIFMNYRIKGSDASHRQVIGFDGIMYDRFAV